MTIEYEQSKGDYLNINRYKLESLPDVEIIVLESNIKPNNFSGGFKTETQRYQKLFEHDFDNKSQAVKFVKDILLDDD